MFVPQWWLAFTIPPDCETDSLEGEMGGSSMFFWRGFHGKIVINFTKQRTVHSPPPQLMQKICKKRLSSKLELRFYSNLFRLEVWPNWKATCSTTWTETKRLDWLKWRQLGTWCYAPLERKSTKASIPRNRKLSRSKIKLQRHTNVSDKYKPGSNSAIIIGINGR